MNEDKFEQWYFLADRIREISKVDMKDAVIDYLTPKLDKFVKWPAAAKHHHNHDGGLLKHTIEVIDITDYIFEGLNERIQTTKLRDELVFCAAIHDVGKINEYYFDEDENVWKYKRPELDHSQWVVYDWNMNSDFKLNLRITEALLSHHGGWSKSGNGCNSLLAAILHSADLISSRMCL